MPPLRSKLEAEKAHKAGAALRLTPNAQLPPEAVADPIAACPFPEGDPQRAEWLAGFVEAHEAERHANDEAAKAVAAALGDKS